MTISKKQHKFLFFFGKKKKQESKTTEKPKTIPISAPLQDSDVAMALLFW